METYVVGIDSGTQSVRVIVFDLQGRIVSHGSAAHAPVAFPQPGWAEQDPNDLWEKLCQASRQAMAGLPPGNNLLAAASLTTQRSVIIPVGADGQTLRPAFSWLDKRQAEDIAVIPGCTGLKQRVRQVSAKTNWMKVHQPELFDRTEKFLSTSGWLTYRLCSQFHDSIGGLVGVYPIDVDRLDWSEDTDLYHLLGMPRQRLPEIFAPGSLLGRITHQASYQTGLPEGLPLVAGTGDKSCEMLGAGAISTDQGYITYGTLAALEMMVGSPMHACQEEYWTNPGAVPGTWNLEFGIECGYLMVRWFCDEFGGNNWAEVTSASASPEEFFSQQAGGIPPGSGGLVLAPYWSHLGIVPDARSVLLGLEKGHTRAHLFRAILEGIAFALREGMEVLARDTGVALKEVFIGGGGAQSDLAVQITADVLGLPLVRGHTVQTCALGTAIEAAVGAGCFASFPEAVKAMTHRERVFLPEPANRKMYDAIYTRIYQKLYPALGQVFTEFKNIFANNEPGG